MKPKKSSRPPNIDPRFLPLVQMMRPPGGGIFEVSAGKGSALELQLLHYKSCYPDREVSAQIVESLWLESLSNLKNAKLALLGVPSDTGAGIRRGAAYGPRGVRRELLKLQGFMSLIRSGSVIDLGDVFVNPHLLHDEMLSPVQKKLCQKEMYPNVPGTSRSKLAVSALSQTRQILTSLYKVNPGIKVFIIGGDHSIAWPVTEVLSKRFPKTLGIVQPDAHTDLLPSRLGVKYCFGTWSYHANNLLGKNGKLVQLGIRQSGKPKEHWEKTLGVRQFWASEILSQSVEKTLQEIIAHLKRRGVKQVYFSNDIDGTDASEAHATGTPADQGLKSEFVLQVIQKIAENFELVAADIMEVAPDLGHSLEKSQATCALAAKYTLTCLEQQVRIK